MKRTELALFVALAGLALLGTGCAIHYYDPRSGVEHLWGFSHMKMKAAKPNEGLQAVVHGTESLGVSLGKVDKQTYFTAGWHRVEYVDVLKDHTSIRLEWPDSRFVNVRVGSRFPVDVSAPQAVRPGDKGAQAKPREEAH